MAQSATKAILSGSSSGQAINISATASPGNLIHTSVTGSSSMDEIWIYAYNGDSSDRTISIQWGASGNPVTQTITTKAGLSLVYPGLLLNGGLSVSAYASATNVVTINGFVNKIV